MISQFLIITLSGRILFNQKFFQPPENQNYLNEFVKNKFLTPSNSNQSSHDFELHRIKWKTLQNLSIILICVSHLQFLVSYADSLLSNCAKHFSLKFNTLFDEEKQLQFKQHSVGQYSIGVFQKSYTRTAPRTKHLFIEYINWNQHFTPILKNLLTEFHISESSPKTQEPVSVSTPKQSGLLSGINKIVQQDDPSQGSGEGKNRKKKKKLKKKQKKKARKLAQMEEGNDPKQNNSDGDEDESFVESIAPSPSSSSETETLIDFNLKLTVDDFEDAPATSSWFSNMVSKITGIKTLTKTEIEPVLDQFQAKLISCNVSPATAQAILTQVGESLINKTVEDYSSLQLTIKQALEQAIVRILQPPDSITVPSILSKIQENKAKSGTRPFVITFCGVNGVGKSTSLAKVAAWLKQNDFSILIAACDTFRTGAVEQLANHASKIGVKLFQQGYNKKGYNRAKDVAQAAIREGSSTGIDVVLVDTTGRMQGNADLMRSLANLVYTIKPDLLFFVGEALVGTDGIDQLKYFNKTLVDNKPSTVSVARTMDGTILTKFDTIDKMVGAPLNMVMTTQQPIVFVGTGQFYHHLKVLDAEMIANTLLH